MRYHSLRQLFLLLAFSVLLPGAARVVNACECGPGRTVLGSFEMSDEVVILRALAVEKAPDTEEQSYEDGVRSTRMIVEKVFKGKLKVGEEIVFGQGGGADCIWTFNDESVGNKYLFYLHRPENSDRTYLPSRDPGLWFAVGCSRSSELDDATDDLLYLENMSKFRGKTRISGTLGGWMNPDLDVAGKTVRIIGPKKTYQTKTDKHGVFEIYDLPPGKYFIEPEIAPGWIIDPTWLRHSPSVVRDEFDRVELRTPRQVPIILEPGKHAGVDISFRIENYVRGRVIGPQGKPMSEVCVYLLVRGEEFGLHDCTDEDGRFEITSITPGEYVLAANPNDRPSSNEPFRKIFYPGVSERERAAVISVAQGQTIDNLDLVIPKLEETITIKGVLRFSDGKPASEHYVQYEAGNEKERPFADVKKLTDREGRFTLSVLKGVAGAVWGEKWVVQGQFTNCSAVGKLLAKSGVDNMDVRSNIVEVTAERNVYNIQLTLPLPHCETVKQ